MYISLRDPSLRYPVPVRRAGRASHGSWSGIRSRNRHPPTPSRPWRCIPLTKTTSPYDVEIRTLRFDEPEHDPPSAEPAEPEPPAMSEEEALILEQEGRAALSEMGEFVPDF